MPSKLKTVRDNDRSLRSSRRYNEQKALKKALDESLTKALEETFPASDPISSLRFT